MNNKRGLSQVISTVILILLAVIAAGVIWYAVKTLVDESLEETEACFNIFEKVTLNNKYTCYNKSSNESNFYISVADIEIDEVLVSISNQESSDSFKITNQGDTFSYLREYSGNYNEIVTLPSENAGKTYVVNTTILGVEDPTSIEIAPIIDNNQCEVSDSIFGIDDCVLLGWIN